MTMGEEETLLTKPEVFVYSIPTRIQKKRGYIHRASDWDVSTPVWHGKLKLITAGQSVVVQLEDKRERLFGKGKVDEYPGSTLDNVVDSSRYFVLEIENKAGDTELVGIGFSSRSDSAEFTTALKDHFSNKPGGIKVEEDAPEAKKPKVEDNTTSESDKEVEEKPKPQRKKVVVETKTEVKTEVKKEEDAEKTKPAPAKKPVSPVKKAAPKVVAKPSPGNKTTPVAKAEVKEESNDAKAVSPVKKVIKPVATVSPQKDAQVKKKETDESGTTTTPTAAAVSTPPPKPLKPILKSILKKSSNPSSPILSVNPAPDVPPPSSVTKPGIAKIKAAADSIVPYKFPEPEPLVPFIETLRGKIPSLPLTPSDTTTTPTTPGKCNIKVTTTTPKATPTKVIKKVVTTKVPVKSTTTTTTAGNKTATPASGLIANPLYKPKPASVAAAAAAKSPTKSVIKTTKPSPTKATAVDQNQGVQSNKKPLVNLAKAAQKAQVVPSNPTTQTVDDQELVSKSDNDNNQKENNDNEVELVELDDDDDDEEENNSTKNVKDNKEEEDNDDVEMIQEEEDKSETGKKEEGSAAEVEKNEKVDEKSTDAEEVEKKSQNDDNEVTEVKDNEEKSEDIKEEEEQEETGMEVDQQEEEKQENEEETGEQEMTEGNEDENEEAQVEAEENEVVQEEDEEEENMEQEEETEEQVENEQEEEEEEQEEGNNENETDAVEDEDIPEGDPDAIEEYLDGQNPLGEIKDIEEELEQLEVPKAEPKVEAEEAEPEEEDEVEEGDEDSKSETISGILPNYKYSNIKTNKFQCHKCKDEESQFDDMRDIKTHWHRVHNLKNPAHCVICKLPFPSRQEMAAHRKAIHGSKCTICGKEFKKEKAVADHMRQAHPGMKAEAVSPNKVLFECDNPSCEGKAFGSEKELQGHKLTHLKHLKCDMCSASFPTRGTLRTHSRNCHPGQ